MLLSTSTNLFAFTPTKERLPMKYCIEACAEAGYKVVDINFCECMNPRSRMRDDDWEKYVDELGELGAKLGLKYTQSHLPYYDLFNDKISDEHKELMEELIRRSIIASSTLGIRWTVTHPATYYPAGQDMSVSKRKNIEYYSKHVENAVKHNIGIALENDFEYKSAPYQHIYCANIFEQTDLIDSFNDPEYVGACYDFGHANMTGGFHRQNLNILGSRLKAVHVADNKGLADEHLLPFHGNIDWKDAMAGLADIDYQGELTYEIQEFGRYYPKEFKDIVGRLSVEVGNILISYFNEAKAAK